MDHFQRPSTYWLRRAEQRKKRGGLRRAAVLERHVLRSDPDQPAAVWRYATTLRQLYCYEASNRELFSALARDPSRGELLGLVGLNMLDTGHTRMAMDAFALYAKKTRTCADLLPPWDDEVCGLSELYKKPGQRRHERLGALLTLAMQCMTRGDMQKAEKYLTRAQQKPFDHSVAKRDIVLAMFFLLTGQTEQVEPLIDHALEMEPFHAEICASAAGILGSIGREKRSLSVLTRAAMFARTPHDELCVCTACDQLRYYAPALAMLRRSLRHQPDRFCVCYHLAVTYFKLGNMAQAMGYLHLCREIDPDDLQAEALFTRALALPQEDFFTVRAFGETVNYTGSPSQQDVDHLFAPILQLMELGIPALARAVSEERDMHSRFLYLLMRMPDQLMGLLSQVVQAMPVQEAEALLREVLVQDDRRLDIKRLALSLLQQRNAQPPYLLMQKNRLIAFDPAKEQQPPASLQQKVWFSKLRLAAALAGKQVIPWAMGMLSRIPPQQRLSIARDPHGVWATALAFHYIVTTRKPAARIPKNIIEDETRTGAFIDALKQLQQEDDLHGLY